MTHITVGWNDIAIVYFRRRDGVATIAPMDTSNFLSRARRTAAAFIALAAWALSQGASAAPRCAPLPGALVDAAQLRALLPCVRVVDIRQGDDVADAPWAAGHIPGAVAAPYAQWRGPADDPGRLLDRADFQALVRSLGLTRDTPVVLVSAGDSPSDFGAPARVYWTLKWLGLRQLAILNGGMQAWSAAHGPLTRAPGAVTASDFVATPQAALDATRTQIAQWLAHEPGAAQLLDARPRAFYLGQVKAPAAWQPGTLPGAQDFAFSHWFPDGSGTLPPLSELQRIAHALPPRAAGRRLVSFCNTGHWAAINWFVLSEVLHQPDVALYPESMVGWSRAHEPMAHVPSRAAQLWGQLQQGWKSL